MNSLQSSQPDSTIPTTTTAPPLHAHSTPRQRPLPARLFLAAILGFTIDGPRHYTELLTLLTSTSPNPHTLSDIAAKVPLSLLLIFNMAYTSYIMAKRTFTTRSGKTPRVRRSSVWRGLFVMGSGWWSLGVEPVKGLVGVVKEGGVVRFVGGLMLYFCMVVVVGTGWFRGLSWFFKAEEVGSQGSSEEKSRDVDEKV